MNLLTGSSRFRRKLRMTRVAMTSAILLILGGCAQNISTYQVDAPIKQGYVEINDGKLFYQIVGKGDPIIVIHGGPGLDQGYLLPGMAALAKKYQVVFYDQRGSGRSVVTNINPQHINTEQFVEDIETLRKSLGFSKVTLVGHSWGGFLALKYAIKYKANLSKLVVMNSLPATTAGIHDLAEEIDSRIEPSKTQLEQIEDSSQFLDNNPEAVADYYRVFFKHYVHNPNSLEKINTQLEPQGVATGLKVSKILEEEIFTRYIDLSDDLKKLKTPTLIIIGAEDIVPINTAKKMAKIIKGSKLVVLEQCGHFPYAEQPQAWLEAMKEFLR